MALTFQDNRLLDPTVQGMLLDRIKQMGGTGIQQDVVWGDLRKNGAYDPQKVNALMALFRAANARGLRPQVRLMGTPAYMAKGRPGVDTTLSAMNPNATVMRQFASDMARAFGGQVSKYSIWNEPNVGSFLQAANERQAALKYRDLFRAGQQGVLASNPNAKIGLGEITGGAPGMHGQDSALGFLKTVLGGKPLHADFVGLHPYQWVNPNTRPANMDPGYGGISNLAAWQNTLRQAFQSGQLRTRTGKRTSLAASEYGYKHDAIPNAATRQAFMRRSMQLFAKNHVRDVNLYQLLPSKPGDYWDSSILGPQGQVPAGYGNLARALR